MRLCGFPATMSMTLGTRARSSCNRVREAISTTIAVGKASKFCWYSIPRSAVTSASNSCVAARLSKSPFLLPAQPICWTVLTSNESGKNLPSCLGTDSSSSSFTNLPGQCRFGLLEHRNRLAPGDSGEAVEEVVQPIASLQVFHQNTDGNPGAGEHWSSAEGVGITVDYVTCHGRSFTYGSKPGLGSPILHRALRFGLRPPFAGAISYGFHRQGRGGREEASIVVAAGSDRQVVVRSACPTSRRPTRQPFDAPATSSPPVPFACSV